VIHLLSNYEQLSQSELNCLLHLLKLWQVSISYSITWLEMIKGKVVILNILKRMENDDQRKAMKQIHEDVIVQLLNVLCIYVHKEDAPLDQFWPLYEISLSLLRRSVATEENSMLILASFVNFVTEFLCAYPKYRDSLDIENRETTLDSLVYIEEFITQTLNGLLEKFGSLWKPYISTVREYLDGQELGYSGLRPVAGILSGQFESQLIPQIEFVLSIHNSVFKLLFVNKFAVNAAKKSPLLLQRFREFLNGNLNDFIRLSVYMDRYQRQRFLFRTRPLVHAMVVAGICITELVRMKIVTHLDAGDYHLFF